MNRQMKKWPVIGGVILAAFGVAQFFPPARNAGVTEGPRSIMAAHPVPAAVQAILRRSCYDCHSNQTRYPWYADFQPVGWWLNRHITQGKAELNFSEFAGYSARHAAEKLGHVSDEVHDRTMPLPSYLWIHRDARLSDADIKLVQAWADDLSGELDPQ